jgi:hypothetical protein
LRIKDERVIIGGAGYTQEFARLDSKDVSVRTFLLMKIVAPHRQETGYRMAISSTVNHFGLDEMIGSLKTNKKFKKVSRSFFLSGSSSGFLLPTT